MKYLALLALLLATNLYASNLDFVVKARVEAFEIDHDGDYLGSGQVKVHIFRNGMDPNVRASFTDLDLGKESFFSISSGEKFKSETFPNTKLGNIVNTINNVDDLKNAHFDLIVSEEDVFVIGPGGIRWDDEQGFPLISNSLDFNLSSLLDDDVNYVNYEKTFSFPEKENRISIKIRFSKVYR
jgi:hypothetical protein